jgi:hypothetical protein
VPGLPLKLRQCYCPNADHAKFFSITQARESRSPADWLVLVITAVISRSDLRQTRRYPAQGPPDFVMKLPLEEERKRSRRGGNTGATAMKLFTGWMVLAGLVLTVVSANAQSAAPRETGRSTSTPASDVGGPYAAMPPEAAVPPGYGPTLLPPREVYTVLRENGFSPIGIPRQRGAFYTIAVIDHRGYDGRLVIDARDGQIVRFVPMYRMGDNLNDDYAPTGALPPISNLRGPPRPPASVPQVASRPAAIPLPKASPPREATSVTEPPQRSAAVQVKPADAPAIPQASAPVVVEAKPAAPQIQPTQPMPSMQGLE